MPVSLTTAKPGDRFEDLSGEIWAYVCYEPGKEFAHYLEDKSGNHFGFTATGEFFGDGVESLNDLIRAIDAPAPAPDEPMGDVGNAKLMEEAAAVTEWLRSMNNHNGRQVAELIDALLAEDDALRKRRHDDLKWKNACRAAGVCMSCAISPPDTFGCTDCLNTGWDGGAPAGFVRDVVHTEALLRATKAEAALDEARKVIAPFADGCSTLRGAHFDAARDWHSKHGGGNGNQG